VTSFQARKQKKRKRKNKKQISHLWAVHDANVERNLVIEGRSDQLIEVGMEGYLVLVDDVRLQRDRLHAGRVLLHFECNHFPGKKQ
jgi:hypothetical protein